MKNKPKYNFFKEAQKIENIDAPFYMLDGKWCWRSDLSKSKYKVYNTPEECLNSNPSKKYKYEQFYGK